LPFESSELEAEPDRNFFRDQQLENTYINLLQTVLDMPSSEAKKTAGDMLEQARLESRREGTANLPQNLGDKFLESEATDETVKSFLGKKRAEGVKDDDIRWWWNMDDMERRMVMKFDAMYMRIQLLKLSRESGLKEPEAMRMLRKNLPVFSITDDVSGPNSEDRPLPYELMDKANGYIAMISQDAPEKLQKEIANSSSMNAFIRKAIKKGDI
jgi:hypothetical protein